MIAESLTFWLAVGGYAVATMAALGSLAFSREPLARWAWSFTLASLAVHTASIAIRWASTGRLPYVQSYENVLAGSWFIVAVFCVMGIRFPKLRIAAAGVLPFVLLTLGYGVTLPPQAGPVTPAYKSAWLVIHVAFAWATYASYTSAAGLGIVQLLQGRRRGVRPGSPLEKLPAADRLVQVTTRLVGFGFLVNGVMIASGSVWAYELWGSYWSWDPVEVWSLLTWIAYGFYLHARLTLGWTGNRLAWIAVLALFGVMMAFWGVQMLPSSYHLFRDIGGVPGMDRF
ncbi:MAG: cytochrome c biogenesis protein CcsA [Coriobacteriia bacterium]